MGRLCGPEVSEQRIGFCNQVLETSFFFLKFVATASQMLPKANYIIL